MPSVTNLMTSMTDIKFQLPYIDIISEDLKKIKKRKTFNLKDNGLDKIRFTEKITLKNVNFSYGGKKNILEDISFDISKGEKVCISGQSGSGKSTLINLILGLLKPTSGKIFIDQEELKFNKKIVWENLSYVPQNCYLIDDTILKILLSQKRRTILI